MTLKDIISIANKAYPDGLVKAYFENPKAKLGDTLAQFIAEELDSVHEETACDAEQLSLAARAMEKAASELNAVANALRAKLNEPLKKLEEERRKAADKAWDTAKLPPVEAVDGWNIDGRFWSRKVFWSNPSGEATCSSIVGSFGVSFEDGSAKILDQWHN